MSNLVFIKIYSSNYNNVANHMIFVSLQVKITKMSQNADMVVFKNLKDEYSLASITFDLPPA